MPPAWFSDAVAATREDETTSVDSARIHYQRWSSGADKPGLLFVHGHAANAHWWDFIAPAFSDRYQVIAMDTSGAGDSDHRGEYSMDLFSREIIAVCKAAAMDRPILVGHSFGGTLARTAAFRYPDAFSGLILVDSAISRNRRARGSGPNRRQTARVRHYSSVEDAVRRFRLRPPQPVTHRYIVDYIASHSVKHTKAGFTFKLDQRLFDKMTESETPLPDAGAMIEAMRIPVALLYGSRSRFFPGEVIESLTELIQPESLIRIDDAYHHVFLDQPQVFISTLKTLLADWLGEAS